MSPSCTTAAICASSDPTAGRGCPSGGEKVYPSAEEASQMAAVLDREPRPMGFLAVLGGTVHRERDRS